jgi:hypothetical protein
LHSARVDVLSVHAEAGERVRVWFQYRIPVSPEAYESSVTAKIREEEEKRRS